MDSLQLTIKRLQEENSLLLQQYHLVQLLSAEQDDMLRMVAHDLKSPLTGIMLGTSFLQYRWQHLSLQDVMHHLKNIEDSTLYMQEMIDRMLTTSMVEEGKSYISLECVEIIDAVALVVDDYRRRSAIKGITLHFESSITSLPMMFNRNILRQLVENILSNAIKYSPPGKEIWIQLIGSQQSVYSALVEEASFEYELYGDSSYNFIRIEIQDEGPGLTKDDQQMLFTKFKRLSARPTNGEDSTGLGLFIVKKLVEAMNGHVWCQSEHGNGARFIMEFPVVEVTEKSHRLNNKSRRAVGVPA